MPPVKEAVTIAVIAILAIAIAKKIPKLNEYV